MSRTHAQDGFTLIELMVGLVLGMIATLAIFSTVSSFESQRRVTGSGVDMQQNGLLALYSIEQDIRMAGYGLIDTTTTPGDLPCTRIDAYSPASVFSSAPVLIANGSAGTDIITVNRLDSDTGGIVTGGHAARVSAALGAGVVPTAIQLDTSKALRTNDFILVSESGLDCSLLKVSASPSATIGASGVDVVPAGNASGDTTQHPAFPNYGASAAVSAVVTNLGPGDPAFATTKYQINGNYDLIRSEDGGANWNAVASNIVAVAAQYGIADVGGQSVNCWTDAVDKTSATDCAGGKNWAAPASAELRRIKGIRVAIVARSAQLMPKTNGVCTTTTTAPVAWVDSTGSSVPPVIDLTAIPDWGCYRYKVYQTIIPVRNVIWGGL
ncbi:MAG TPA: PilW family protein [Gallionella sp.]|nr:PilW family protein [Gallionella sp.]